MQVPGTLLVHGNYFYLVIMPCKYRIADEVVSKYNLTAKDNGKQFTGTLNCNNIITELN